MPAARYRLLRILAGLFIFLLGCPPPNQPPEELFVQGVPGIGQAGFTLMGDVNYLAPKSTGSFLLQVRDPSNGNVVSNGEVTVSLADPGGSTTRLFSGKTNAQGVVQVSFTVPETVTNPNQVLVVESKSRAGNPKYQENVYVGRAFNVLVSSDKPVYQPGQTIHIRALALDTLALSAANGQDLTITVSDPNGNKVARRTLTTSQYGIASTDFALDNQATSGDYIISAEIGPVTSTHSVTVKPYNLPRFKIEFKSDKSFYLPGETASGEIDANYFFGKPVNGGQVTIRGYTSDVDRVQVAEVSGVTDESGKFKYSLTIPDYLVGQLENNAATVDLEISVVDNANHAESSDESITVAEKTVLLEAVPESGSLRPGVDNIIYVDATYPDGRAAPGIIQVNTPLLTNTLSIATDDYGLASFVVHPQLNTATDITLTATTTPTATAVKGDTATQHLTLSADQLPNAVLLRPDHAQYRIGDTMNLDIHVAGHPSTVYLDIIKGKQSFALVSLPIANGVAQAAIDIDGSLLGTLELNAYVINDTGEIVRDRRLVLVNPAPAQVEVHTDAGAYHPGDKAKVDIDVSRDGAPMEGALGVSIVDESVFSVGAQDPGFARTYFLLERELAEPRYEIRGFSNIDADQSSPYDDTPESVRIGSRTVNPALDSNQDKVAAAHDTALKGLFAHELTAMNPPTQPAKIAASPVAASGWGWLTRVGLIAPLLGLAFYDGTKSRRRLLIATMVFTLGAFFYGACASPAAPAAAPAAASGAAVAGETTAARGAAQPPRLRQYFPETLYWMPEVETDAKGHAQIELPVADSITTWRISVIASDKKGNIGSGEASMPVFQDFFVEPDLPRFLTVGDEIDIPVALYNYLDTPQTIQLSVKAASWFELRGDAEQSIKLAANEVSAAYIPIRVLDFGAQKIEFSARGSKASDAIARDVEVVPNGRPQASVQNGQLEAAHSFAVSVPANAIPGTGRVTVKLYPGVVSQAIDGLDGMLQEPYGCFEQTSSVNYPNVLVLDYLRATKQQSPAIELRAESYIDTGYQRLLTFEVPGEPGGFSLFGTSPAETMLTAYGLMEFTDMARVHYVDPALLARTAKFLTDRQQADGSWIPEQMSVSTSQSSGGGGDVAATAYIAWALADAGFAGKPVVANALTFIANHLDTAHADPYVLALAANAYAAAGQPSPEMLNKLASLANSDSDNSLRWASTASGWLREFGGIVDLETTSMAALAFLRSNQHIDVAERAIKYISNQRSNFGTWGSTYATIMALKALTQAARTGGEGGSATVTLSLGGSREHKIIVDGSNSDVVQSVTFDDIGADPSELMISKEGNRAVQYQVSTEYYQPWPGPASTPSTPGASQGVRINVAYDRTQLAVNDLVQVKAEVELLSPGVAGTLLVDLGIPPGFTPLTEDLDDLVNNGMIARYELTGRQIIVYMNNVPSGQNFDLTYRLQARFPISALSPSSTVYDYYTPDQQATVAPQRIVVTLGTPK